ncbi:MAG: TldD/PmbA family protein [Candidatus Zipacnadales bacterium]
MEELLDFAVQACEWVMAAGAEFAHVHASQGRSFSVLLEKGAIKASQSRQSSGLVVTAYYRGGSGGANADVLDSSSIKKSESTAAALDRQSDPDPDFVSLPCHSPLPDVEGLYDERIAGLSSSQVIAWALAATDEALTAVPEALISGGAAFSVGESALANSQGVRVLSPYSSVSCSIEAVVRRGDNVGVWFDYTHGRTMDDFALEGVGRRAAEGALQYLDARDIPSGDYPMVLGPWAGTSIYHHLAHQANAEDVQRNRSYLIGKRGQRIASEVLTIIDDPLIPRGLASSRCDADGVPHRPLTIVENGVLLTYLHNHYTANKAGEPNTAHSSGDGISPTNVNIRLGTRPAAELIAEIDDGIYLACGGPRPDGITGDFSSTVDFGFKIEKGEIVYPIRNAAIGGHFLELLQDLDEVSSDYREEPGSKMPTLRFRTVRLAGSG